MLLPVASNPYIVVTLDPSSSVVISSGLVTIAGDNVGLARSSNQLLSLANEATIIADISNIQATIDTPTSFEAGGKIAVGVAAVQVTFTGTTKVIIIQADPGNSGILYIGPATVTSAGVNAMVALQAGDAISLNYNDSINSLWVVASVAAQNFIKGALLS